MTKVSTLGIQLASIERLGKGQSNLETLSGQLSSGIKSSHLADYTSTEAKNLLDLNASMTRKEAYVNAIELVQVRVNTYDKALTGIEKVVSQTVTLCGAYPAYNSQTNSTAATTIRSYLEEMEYYLNQKVGDRYIFAGTRYDVCPAKDLTSADMLTEPASATVQTDPHLPEYDAEYDPLLPVNDNAAAYAEDRVALDLSTKLTYGISSDNAAFQKVILALRYAYAATQDPTNYTTLMGQATTLINEGLGDVQALHSALSSNNATLESVKDKLNNDIDNMSNQISDIQGIDTNEVSVRISAQQTQMEAAYSVTSKLITLSIVKYL